jgi:rod shape-determining protein MreC
MANGTWRIARRGNAQLPLAIVAALAIALILIGKAQSQLFDRARTHVTDFLAPALEVMRTPLSDLNRTMGSIGEIFAVYQENLRLKEENARLRQWRNTAIVLQDRVHRYQLLLHAIPDPELSSVMARVIGRASHPFLETMILDAGRAQGVKPGQAVIDARGMIGRIFITGDHTAWVILLTDLNSRIPVTIEPGNIQAIMGGDNSPAPSIEIVSQNATLKQGDQVVSSGDGSLLPPGLPIGTVYSEPSTGAFRVSLLADAASSQDVEVIDFRHPPESPPPASQSDLPATAAGLAPAASPPLVTAPQPGVVTVNSAGSNLAPHPASPGTAPVASPPAAGGVAPGATQRPAGTAPAAALAPRPTAQPAVPPAPTTTGPDDDTNNNQ